MKVIIAEKPDQAKTLVSQFKHKKADGYILVYPNELFPNGAYCTWAVGHLLQLSPPETYNPKWKKWDIESLPIIPNQFTFDTIPSKRKQFHIIRQLVHKEEVTEIIHAGDAGREGELIIRLILHECKVNKPLKRLWISSLTEAAIYDGFSNLIDEKETKPLFFEAYTRSCADWVIGMNASRVFTILLKQRGYEDVFSAGRVQTPTLALIVKREREIASFTSEEFWEVEADFSFDKGSYRGKWMKDGKSRLKTKEQAEKIAQFCEGKSSIIKEFETERKTFKPPLLFSLSSLQAKTNQLFKYSPKKTLDILQRLYQRGLISYPRSDSSYVTKGEAATFPQILANVSEYDEYNHYFPLPKSILHNKRYVNEKKVTDHYAIIPTTKKVDIKKLSAEDKNIYDLIVRQLLAAHCEDAIYDYTTLTTTVDEQVSFLTKGKKCIKQGWRKIAAFAKEEKDILLPDVNKGDKGVVKKTIIKNGKTEPPKRFTEGQLITLMKTAGKYIENDELEKVLNKTEGLGTEATRANIITMLKDRKYIDVKKNMVYATDKGKLLIDVIGDTILASPEMTAKWEQRLAEIGEGQASAKGFMEQIKKLAHVMIEGAISSSTNWNVSQYEQTSSLTSKYTLGKTVGPCLLCNGKIVDKGEFYGCSHYKKTKCTFTISKMMLGKKLTKTNVKKLLEHEQTNVIKGFKKGEQSFDAKLLWNKEKKKIEFQYVTNDQQKQ
ncbi:DNA topoisomerase III [Alkalihalobacterium bogoriense]|uniref:DNA topoisomerase III n=1 Tax=Alkalihalobacterium bogoriense TaxID=246272 RepID=UPI00047D9310|nr:DNA topoisomerase III [Alkalihalobacterium bogoriense]